MNYRKKQLPQYIDRLKSMVQRNYEIMIKPVDSVIFGDLKRLMLVIKN